MALLLVCSYYQFPLKPHTLDYCSVIIHHIDGFSCILYFHKSLQKYIFLNICIICIRYFLIFGQNWCSTFIFEANTKGQISLLAGAAGK